MHRVIAGLLVLIWLAPSGAAAQLARHWGNEHDDLHHHAELQLALAALHGHSHAVDTADHDHSAMRPASPFTTPEVQQAVDSSETCAPETGCAAPPVPYRLRPGPSPQLFTAHCALLI